MNTCNILIADDHKIMRHGIMSIMKQEESIGKLYEASTGKETLSQCKKYEEDIDVVIIDISMPDMNGIEASRKIKQNYPDIEIIALSMLKDEESIRKMLKAGASGYVLKDAGKKDLLESIESVRQGKPYYSEEVTLEVMKEYTRDESETKNEEKVELTDREIEILQYIADEYTNQQIAEKLFISKRTVDTHRTNLLSKTNSKNTAGLVRYAVKNNLI